MRSLATQIFNDYSLIVDHPEEGGSSQCFYCGITLISLIVDCGLLWVLVLLWDLVPLFLGSTSLVEGTSSPVHSGSLGTGGSLGVGETLSLLLRGSPGYQELECLLAIMSTEDVKFERLF